MTTAAYEFISYEKAGHVAVLTIKRPDSMNALHPPATEEMHRVWTDFNDDPEMWVGIVTGEGDRAFSAGMDLRWRAQQDAAGEPQRSPGDTVTGGFGGLTNPREVAIWKPLIAAVNGYALGGGLELAMACDIIVAADTARFGLPEVTRGIVAGAGGMHRLPRQIPLKIAMGYMLTGKHMTAEEAHHWGLVNEVVPADQLMDTAKRWAAEICDAAPLSVRASKQSALLGLEMTLEEAYNTRFPAQQAMQGSEDSREGPRAFAERRKPVWKGR
jgi:enoyl-CoA hydratase/carnithine racemase